MVGREKASPDRTRARRKRATSKQDFPRRMQTVPVGLSIAGSDSSAGAGVQADLKTFSALGVYGLTAVSRVVADIHRKVSRIEPVSAVLVREQINVLAETFPIAAIKTGLLYSREIIKAVARAIVDFKRDRIPLIVDPVMIATSGDRLLEPPAVEAYETELFPLAALITPNLDEAAWLLETKIKDRQSMEKAVRELAKKYRVSVLLKGGHLAGSAAVDLLFA